MERAALVGLTWDSGRTDFQAETLAELEELVDSAGGQVVAVFVQQRSKPNPAFLIGTGKVKEVAECVQAEEIDLVVFDEDLSPVQSRNLEKELQVKILDRSELILDIFAQRARSAAGRRQVELAQLQYLLPRLTGRGTSLSRLGGGIGTRGPGETKLEVDRRRIRTRISRLKQDLVRLEKQRALHRSKRQGVPIPTLSLVGYTNAGKSTLFNSLTDSGTLVSSKMFATLDPLVRRIALSGGQEALIGDTVGFIRKLPHTLVAAFHATLEEALEADLLLHVIDASHPHADALRLAVYQVLDEIGYGGKPVLEVYNKMDLLDGPAVVDADRDHVLVSAVTKSGLDDLLKSAEELLNRKARLVTLRIPYDEPQMLSRLRGRVRIDSERYQDDGVVVTALLPQAEWGRFADYAIEPATESRSQPVPVEVKLR